MCEALVDLDGYERARCNDRQPLRPATLLPQAETLHQKQRGVGKQSRVKDRDAMRAGAGDPVKEFFGDVLDIADRQILHPLLERR